MRTLSARRAVAGVAAVTLASFAVAGCGDEATSGRASSTSSVASDGATYSGEVEQVKADILQAAYDAAVDAGAAHFTMRMTGGDNVSGDGDLTYDGDPAMQMTMTTAGQGAMQLRLVGGVLYLQIPGISRDGKFMALDPTDKRSPLGSGFQGLAEQMDPLSSMKKMQAAVKDVKLVGQDEVGGVETNHYVVSVDTARLMGEMKTMQKDVASSMPATLTYDLWTDEDDLLRKMTFELTGVRFEMLMTDWGKAVTVQKPAADEIMPTPGA